ncbi:myosin heavy chain, fast skeletal muscle [Neodiprion pinetum]|uniref:myosin heavy chain, fast skeletal muscle n=1 Tax=Neodiprion pinetum TaxID=441929 RepID=UPI001EE0D266|nr:myosin-4 [Neodiprion pinetum]
MKKRRPCTWNQVRSPGNLPNGANYARTAESVGGKSRSFHELKKRRIQKNVTKVQQTKSSELNNDVELSKELFGSLESLFDVKKPLRLQDLPTLSQNYAEQGDTTNSTPQSRSPKTPRYSLDPPEPHILFESKSFIKLTEFGLLDEIVEESLQAESNKTNTEQFSKSQECLSMADEEDKTETQGENEGESEDKGGDAGENSENGPPPHPMPPGIGEGVPIKPGGHRESTMSSLPLTDTAVMKEMKEADKRCTAIAAEIEQLKKELTELTNKKDLTQEDTLKIKEKQESVMTKLGEFEKITRKLQRLLGLADPSSQTFAKMFEMLPYPHGKRTSDVTKEKGELFDIPQMEYPEDKLPRVIVCGNTEENIPKIVVGDSERKGKKKCFQNLTGKLTESLNMQEKLVKENAQLEGGRYKLEEALLEKDNAVDSLQRKVCGLQAEMRIVVKENSELSRQLACLNQRICSPRQSPPPPPPLPPPVRPYTSNRGIFLQDEDSNSCACKCCLQQEGGDTCATNTRTVCVNDPSKVTGSYSSNGSPRLSGGACCGNTSGTESEKMCCRSPAANQMPPPAPRGACPAELENKLAMYGNNTKQLEQQLGCMESEVRNMQMELANVQRERQQLEQQRKLLKCTGPCAPCSCCPPSQQQSQQSQQQIPQLKNMPPAMPLAKMNPQQVPSCAGPCTTAPMGGSNCPQQQLRDLREQYARLQDDYKSKLCEVSVLRTESEKTKQEARDAKEDKERAENKLIDLEERLKLCEAEKNKLAGSKEQLVEQEQALLVAKQRFREAQDELEELRSLIQDQASQLEDYRNKYLQAQQQVEEQRRQLDLMEMDNARMNENVTLEIGRVKNQFQEKLAELAPLPDLLKQTQLKLQESQQMRLLAERNCEDLSREVLVFKDKVGSIQNQMDILRAENQTLQDEKASIAAKWDELERRNAEMRNENERMKNASARFEEHIAQMQKRIDEKMHEVTQLTAMLDQVREDSARQVARTKERCETVRRSMQGQIAEMERQLAQCRATARAAQKDRDEIRQKMQGQINNLNEAFEHAQGRIRSLQGHVNYLKNSYSNIFRGGQGQGQGETPPLLPGEPGQGQGYDSCDCNY